MNRISGTKRRSSRAVFWLCQAIAATAVAKLSPERRSANNKSARCVLMKMARTEKCRKIKKKKQSGLVSVTEKTKRLSGVSRGPAGSFGKLDGDLDLRGHD